MAHRIAVIGVDGIGPEVTAEALKVVRAAGVAIETTDFDLGGQRYLRDGEILSDAVLEQLRHFDAILLGAVGTPDVPPGVIERGLLLKMRFELDLYVNQRPFVGVAPGKTAVHDFVSFVKIPKAHMWVKVACCAAALHMKWQHRAAPTRAWVLSVACVTHSNLPPRARAST